MTEDRLPLAELLAKAGDGDFLRSVAETVLQMLMEADVEGLIGAGRHERTGERLNYRNGYPRPHAGHPAGSLQLRIPKLRQGSYFPPFLEPRKTSEKALVAVIQEAWIGGVSTRRVDELVQAMGLSGISKSRSRSSARTSTSGLAPSSIGRWPASGPISGSMRPTCAARGRPHRVGGGDNRRGLRCRGAAARSSAWASVRRRPRPSGRLPQEPGQARPEGREAGRLRCP